MSSIDLPPDGSSGLAEGAAAVVGVPAVGELGYDSGSGRVGRVMEVRRTVAWLRPAGGGREWEVPRDRLHPAGHAGELRARVAELNAASRWGL